MDPSPFSRPAVKFLFCEIPQKRGPAGRGHADNRPIETLILTVTDKDASIVGELYLYATSPTVAVAADEPPVPVFGNYNCVQRNSPMHR